MTESIDISEFEQWCRECVTIKDKVSGNDVPFVLNAPQRRLAALFERQRQAGSPIRVIMLKARQWGGSTLVQVYMAWMQMEVCLNWHSLICAHVRDSAANIRGIYSKLLSNYPESRYHKCGGKAPVFAPFERSQNVRIINGRGCRVTIATAESQDAMRGADIAMAHLSETAFWPATPQRSPEDLVRAICGSVALAPNTMIVMESTANGVGNYFLREWLRSVAGKSDKVPFFVPWYEIDMYRLKVPASIDLDAELDDYERRLLIDRGLTAEQVWWYHCKRREYPTHDKMQAEYPTTADEAFANSGSGVFALEHIAELRKSCVAPLLRGEVTADGAVVADSRGAFVQWRRPRPDMDYVVTVDIGGRSEASDYSVVAVLTVAEVPEVVAQWRGHIDHDLLATKAMAIATLYNEALLVVESNTLESDGSDNSYGGLFVLNRLAENYPRLYRRQSFDTLTQRSSWRIGFHTNRATKALVVDALVEAVRTTSYIERDGDACDEMASYEQRPNGTFAAAPGCHDDILMTRGIALTVIAQTICQPAPPPPPRYKSTFY